MFSSSTITFQNNQSRYILILLISCVSISVTRFVVRKFIGMSILRSHTKRARERENDRSRITELPEPLIHHILSFLPIESAVATSILSKYWRYLWTSIPVIDFCNSAFIGSEKTEAFMRFADRVLCFRQDEHSPYIKKFCLSVGGYFDQTKVNEWICIVLRRKVEEMIFLTFSSRITLPSRLFTCESLTMLDINMVHLPLPESVNFPKLKILRLNVNLENEHLIPKLLSNSPVREELSLKVYVCDIQDICICSPKLKRLFIKTTLRGKLNIQINAQNLQSFKYSSYLAEDFVLHNFPTLVDAEIDLSSPAVVDSREVGILGYLAAKLFGSLSNVKRLTISDYTLKLLSHRDHTQTKLPSFYNLINLEVMSNFFNSRQSGNLHCWVVRTLLDFLHVSPNLESLIFVEGFFYPEYDNVGSWSLDTLPECLLLHVKSIEFRGFFWNQFEKDLIRSFLKNATVLQKVRITISSWSFLSKESNYKNKVLDEIALFPRGSPECVLHVS